MEKKFTVSCFSANFDNTLMWSHYSDNHKGICVEFEFDSLSELFVENFEKMSIDKVSYSTELPKYYTGDEISKNVEEVFEKQSIYTKSIDWAYENEIRIIILNIPPGPIKFKGVGG